MGIYGYIYSQISEVNSGTNPTMMKSLKSAKQSSSKRSAQTGNTKKRSAVSSAKIHEYLEMGDLYYDAHDYKKALEYFQKAANAGDVTGMVACGNCCDDLRMYGEAASWYEKAMKKGSNEATFLLGGMYFLGREPEFPIDRGKGIYYMKKAADGGLDEAQLTYGVILYRGSYIEADPCTGLMYLRRAAEQYQYEAEYYIGESYLNGKCVAKNQEEALRHFEKAAHLSQNPDAYFYMGYIYLYGDKPLRKELLGEIYLRKAGELGLSDGYCLLGTYYQDKYESLKKENADGQQNQYLKSNYQENKAIADAISNYEKAADMNNCSALNSLGMIYINGNGVDENIDKAVGYFKKGAELGWAACQYNLGYCYYNGIGMPQNLSEARRLMQESASQGYSAASDFINHHFAQ